MAMKWSILLTKLRLNKPLRLAQAGLVVTFLTLGLTFSLTAPLMTGSDQLAHFFFIRFIAKHGRLPVSVEEREEASYKSSWPPLFHLLIGMAGRGINLDEPPFIKVSQDNPRLQLIFGTDDLLTERALTTEDPFRSEQLLWCLGRFGTLLWAFITLIVIYLLIRAFHSDTDWLVLGATALLAFTPTYILTSGVISYEPLLGMFLAFYFLLLFYTLRYPGQKWLYLGLGLLLGLAALTKQTPWPAIAILPLLIIWLAYQYRWTPLATACRLILFGLGLMLTTGIWVLYLGIYFNKIDELGWVDGLLSAVLSGPIDPTSQRLARLVTEGSLGGVSQFTGGGAILEWFWNVVGGIWHANWLTWIFAGLWGIAILGLVRQWRQGEQQIRLWLVLLITHIGLFMIAMVLRFLLTGNPNTGEGQHIFFPAAAPLILLFIWGLKIWLPSMHLAKLLFVMAGLCLWQSIVAITQVYYPPWPIRTVTLPQGEKSLATFGEISLIGYEYHANDQLLETTLWWRAEALMSEDYQVEVTLLDSDNKPQARWLGQPLNGYYPTRAWMPEDRIRHVIQIPIAGLPAGDYQSELRLLGRQVPGENPPIYSLGKVELNPSPLLRTASSVVLNNQKIDYTHWKPNWPIMSIPIYGERATILFSTYPKLGDEIRLSLIGPDGQPHAPFDHIGNIYNFYVEPEFMSGEYRLRFEYGSEASFIDQVETPPLVRIATENRQFEVGPISHPVMANFNDEIILLGYDLPQRRVQAGSNLPIILYWQALKTMADDLITFNHLINEDQKFWGGQDRLIREIYSTILWVPGEIVTDPFDIRIDADAPDGIYHLLVGIYRPVDDMAVSLPLIQEGKLTHVTSINIGPIKVGNTPDGLTVNVGHPQTSLNQPLGNAITLLGYDLLDQDNRPVVHLTSTTSHLQLTLYWRSEVPVSTDYTTFVHLRNKAGEIVAQKDQPPLGGAYPVSLWDKGEIIEDQINISLGELESGQYELVIGMYDFVTGQRLPVAGSPDNAILLESFEVK